MSSSVSVKNPILNDSNIAYFDYAATTFMPKNVIDKWVEFHNTHSVFISRGNNTLSVNAMNDLLYAESVFRSFFDISDNYDFIYTKNVTEAINIVALSLQDYIKPLDIILVGPYEHHSNYLPWKYLCKKTGALFCEMPLDDSGKVDYTYISRYKKQIKIISVSSVSNAFGYKLDIKKICNLIDSSTLLFVDESQSCAHKSICTNNKIAVHFIPSHKMYGPKNIALCSIKKDILNLMNPVLLGGGMVESVGYNDKWLEGRMKFFAGTMDIGLIVAMAESCKYISSISFSKIEHDDELYSNRIKSILHTNNCEIISSENSCANHIISFKHKILHAHDVCEYLSSKGVIIRCGNLCTQNSLMKIETNAINRISLGIGVSNKDINRLEKCLGEIK